MLPARCGKMSPDTAARSTGEDRSTSEAGQWIVKRKPPQLSRKYAMQPEGWGSGSLASAASSSSCASHIPASCAVHPARPHNRHSRVSCEPLVPCHATVLRNNPSNLLTAGQRTTHRKYWNGRSIAECALPRRCGAVSSAAMERSSATGFVAHVPSKGAGFPPPALLRPGSADRTIPPAASHLSLIHISEPTRQAEIS